MIVGFSIIPLGKGESLSEDVVKAVKIIEESGLKYQLGPWPVPPVVPSFTQRKNSVDNFVKRTRI